MVLSLDSESAWHEVLVDTLLEEKEGAFLVLKGVTLRGLCCFLGRVFGFFQGLGLFLLVYQEQRQQF